MSTKNHWKSATELDQYGAECFSTFIFATVRKVLETMHVCVCLLFPWELFCPVHCRIQYCSLTKTNGSFDGVCVTARESNSSGSDETKSTRDTTERTKNSRSICRSVGITWKKATDIFLSCIVVIYYYFISFHFSEVQMLRFLGRQISWLSEWVIEYAIFLHGLA